MEKIDNEDTNAKYRIPKELKYRDTMDDAVVLFKNIVPAKTEHTQDELKKINEIEYSENNIIKTFKMKASAIFHKGNLVFYTKDNKYYKVVDLKTDDEYKPVSASLVVKDGDDKLDITDQSEFVHFQDFIELNMIVKPDNKDNIFISVKQKLYDKFEDTLDATLNGIGYSLIGFKIYHRGKEIDKTMSVAQIDDMQHKDIIFAAEGLGKPYKFNRFKSVYTSYGWSNSGNYPDGIAFIPQQNIKVCGFSTFAARSKDQYEMRYRVRIDGNDVEDETITASGWEDQYYYRHRLKGIYDAKSGSKIEFTCWIAESLSAHSYVETYYGEGGYEYEQFENEHMGLFKIESGGESSNGTSVYSGHFGEIFYYLG